jgi:hypothetical protein
MQWTAACNSMRQGRQQTGTEDSRLQQTRQLRRGTAGTGRAGPARAGRSKGGKDGGCNAAREVKAGKGGPMVGVEKLTKGGGTAWRIGGRVGEGEGTKKASGRVKQG